MKSIGESHEEDAENVELIQNLATTDGKLESPINLDIRYMKVISLPPLRLLHYDTLAKKLKITNTGYTAVLSATWQREVPRITGGPFLGNYVLSQIHFHWGKNEMNGSEHHIDGCSMPMELHTVHFKTDYATLETALRKDDGVAVVVYMIKGMPNPALDAIVKALSFIQTAHSSIRLTPMVLANILRPFDRDYFLYWGSVITVHYVHTILWIVSREPIGISTAQLAEFRTLKNERNEPIVANCRPLKDHSHRQIFHVRPSGSTYASLLPIPRASLPAISNTNKIDETNNRSQ